ncbi:MAG: htpG [Francisellaceae bacterium]|nr:htpG [Francisellaceae bacterium]
MSDTIQETPHKQTLGFQAEVKQLLQLMIHSLYSNKEIFIRELISNASDAADKLRFGSLSNPSILKDDVDLKVRVDFDKDKNTITFSDNGIGMSRDEVIQNLGTIAKSGTKEFLSSLTGDKAKDSSLIGQFGVGFYSSFIVAEKVVVETRRADSKPNEAIRWISTGEGDYEIENIEKETRGTTVTLYLKKEEEEFLNEWKLRNIITKYSDHISLPVIMRTEKFEETLPSAEEGKEEESTPKKEIVDEVVNRASALWTLPKNEIKDEQYKELYKHVGHDFEDPLTWTHFKVEGKLEYTSILYIPKRAPYDFWNTTKPKGLKLYVQRVFIMDDAEQFLPNYLRFTRGIVDSNDLPLNVSRELLQSTKITDAMRQALTKRILGLLEQMASDQKENYLIFWKEFGQVLKEGPAEDFTNKEQIAKLLRFATTHNDSPEQEISLEEYLKRMPETQTKIYYIAADSFNAAKNSPHLEIFRKKGIEVLLLSDRVDEWLMMHLTEFDKKPIQSVTRGELELGELDEKANEAIQKAKAPEFEAMMTKAKEILADKVKDIRLSHRLTNSPACLVVDQNDMTSHMERLFRQAGQKVPTQKPILELNPDHLLIKRMNAETNGSGFNDWVQVLFEQALLAEGGQLEDPATFVKRFNDLLLQMAQ